MATIKRRIFRQFITIQLLFVSLILFSIKTAAQNNTTGTYTLNIKLLNNSQCIVEGKEIAFTNLEKELEDRPVFAKEQWAVINSDSITIIFQDVMDVLTVLNKYNYKIRTKRPIIISGIYFDLSAGPLRVESTSEVDKISDFLKENKNLKIEIGNHTDSRGATKPNIKLSEYRAEGIAKYLVYKGVDEDRFITKGYGREQLLIKNAKTEYEHSINRRTELKIIY